MGARAADPLAPQARARQRHVQGPDLRNCGRTRTPSPASQELPFAPSLGAAGLEFAGRGISVLSGGLHFREAVAARNAADVRFKAVF